MKRIFFSSAYLTLRENVRNWMLLWYSGLSEGRRDGCYMMHSGKLETYKMFGQKSSREEVTEKTDTDVDGEVT